MTPTNTLDIKAAVVTLKLLHNGNLVVMDQKGNLRQLDVDTLKTVGGFKTNIEQERSWGNHMSVSASGKYAASVIPHTNRSALYDIEAKKLLYMTSRHKGDLESVRVDDNNHYLVTGGTDGKTYVWNIGTEKLLYAFPPHADYVTALEINSVWIASASYDKTISVLNLTTMQTPVRLRGHSSVIIQMKLLKNMRMLSVERGGAILLWDLKKGAVLQRFVRMNDDVTCFAMSSDEKFLFVGTKLGTVSLYEAETGKQLKKHFLKEESKITAISVLDAKGELAVGTNAGLLNFYPLIPDKQYLLERLKNRDYDGLYEEAKKNPLLYYSPVYFKLEELWENTFLKAAKMLENGEKTNAEAVLSPFSKVSSKRAAIQDLLKDYEEFNKFRHFVNEKKYSLAYPLANRHPHFKQSDVYKMMENEWHVNFNKAKTCLMQKEGDEKIRRLLNNFKGISEKSILIQELFQQRTAYMLFTKILAKKDYKAIFNLLNKCPFIKEFDEYDKLLEYADECYIKAQQSIERKDYSNAVMYAYELMNFPDFTADAKEMIENTRILEQFSKAFASNDMALMYQMIGEHPFLVEMEEAKALEEDWHHHLLLAEKYASKADVVNTVASLEDFFEIKAKHLPIAVVLQQAYIAQLNRALRSKKSQTVVQNAIKQYVVFFGIDDHIENYIEFFQADFDLSCLQKGDIKMFRPFMIIPDIVK